MKYAKPPLSIEEQISLLKKRGLIVNNHNLATHYLSHLNYYRLSGYWLPFELKHSTHQFVNGTSFEQIIELYVFDRQLRLLTLDAIERVEISVRAQWAYTISNKYGTHPHLDHNLFKPGWDYEKNFQILQNEVTRSKERFANHLRNKYRETLPPIWGIVEIMSLGQLSKWVANMRHRQDRNAIANTYDMNEVNLVSFLHHLTIVRNICAHHSRLWNREFTFTFKLPNKRPTELPNTFNRDEPRKIYNTLVMLAWLMEKSCPDNKFKTHLNELLTKHSINIRAMGFPEYWNELEFWKE